MSMRVEEIREGRGRQRCRGREGRKNSISYVKQLISTSICLFISTSIYLPTHLNIYLSINQSRLSISEVTVTYWVFHGIENLQSQKREEMRCDENRWGE